jgi:hypothetical protein
LGVLLFPLVKGSAQPVPLFFRMPGKCQAVKISYILRIDKKTSKRSSSCLSTGPAGSGECKGDGTPGADVGSVEGCDCAYHAGQEHVDHFLRDPSLAREVPT